MMEEKRRLKNIALELLEKYESAQKSVIWERGSDIDSEFEALSDEIEKYRKEIENEKA